MDNANVDAYYIATELVMVLEGDGLCPVTPEELALLVRALLHGTKVDKPTLKNFAFYCGFKWDNNKLKQGCRQANDVKLQPVLKVLQGQAKVILEHKG
jgi:hypothetical protein